MKRYRILIGICVLVFLLGVAGCVYLLSAPASGQISIVQDGKTLYSIDLASAKNQTLKIEYDGRINLVQIENGRVRMLDADCPDQLCVRMGWLNARGIPIVCLPNHLLIQFSSPQSDVDAQVQ